MDIRTGNPTSSRDYAIMQSRIDEIRRKHSVKALWPEYRGDPSYPPLPETWNEGRVLDAVIEALNQEGVDAWPGDATLIITQLIQAQFDRWKDTEARLQRAEAENAELAQLLATIERRGRDIIMGNVYWLQVDAALARQNERND